MDRLAGQERLRFFLRIRIPAVQGNDEAPAAADGLSGAFRLQAADRNIKPVGLCGGPEGDAELHPAVVRIGVLQHKPFKDRFIYKTGAVHGLTAYVHIQAGKIPLPVNGDRLTIICRYIKEEMQDLPIYGSFA